MGIYDRNYYRDDVPEFRPWDRASMVTNLIIVNSALLILNFIFSNRTGAVTSFLMLNESDLFRPLQWYRFLTYGFAHSDIMHLLFNMLTLYFLGQSVEARYGRWEFLRFYLLTIVASGLAFCLLRLGAPGMIGANVLGASGAVVGVVMLFVFNFPQATIMLWGVLPLKAWLLGVLTILLNLIGTSRQVAYDVHLAGAACATIYYYGRMDLSFMENWAQVGQYFKRRPKLRVHKAEDEEEVIPSRDEREADRLLEKIHQDGQGSLTAKEQKFLEQYSRRVREKRTRT